MKKKYFYTIFFILMFFAIQQGGAQVSDNNHTLEQENIEGLSIYPNPVKSGRQYVYILSKKSSSKTIKIFNVLGKQISSTVIKGKKLDISKLNRGGYILKISENSISETRKLIIK